MEAPKVFISHASEDKISFVIPFATRLRANGIDAWIDKWEMLPGDSLVDKIFESGIKDASAVIVVLSRNSVGKPWVREEINAAFVSRINKSSKLIPVVLDDCEVPACLQTTLWERISDLNSYEDQYKRIELSIFGKTDKPPIGTPPVYARSKVEVIDGLTEIDSIIFRIICEYVIETEHPFPMSRDVIARAVPQGISPELVVESIEVLETQGFIELTEMLEPSMNSFKVHNQMLEEYFKHFNRNYGKEVDAVGAAIVNHGLTTAEAIVARTGLSSFLVNHILELLDSGGLINNTRLLGGNSIISNVAVELRRAFRN